MNRLRLWLSYKLVPNNTWRLVNKQAGTRIILHVLPSITVVEHDNEESFYKAAVKPNNVKE